MSKNQSKKEEKICLWKKKKNRTSSWPCIDDRGRPQLRSHHQKSSDFVLLAGNKILEHSQQEIKVIKTRSLCPFSKSSVTSHASLQDTSSATRPLIVPVVEEGPTCRICFGGADEGELVQPCSCKGTVGFVHPFCLLEWQKHRSTNICGLCQSPYADLFKLPWTQRLKNLLVANVSVIVFWLFLFLVDVSTLVVFPVRLDHLISRVISQYNDTHEGTYLNSDNREIKILSTDLSRASALPDSDNRDLKFTSNLKPLYNPKCTARPDREQSVKRSAPRVQSSANLLNCSQPSTCSRHLQSSASTCSFSTSGDDAPPFCFICQHNEERRNLIQISSSTGSAALCHIECLAKAMEGQKDVSVPVQCCGLSWWTHLLKCLLGTIQPLVDDLLTDHFYIMALLLTVPNWLLTSLNIAEYLQNTQDLTLKSWMDIMNLVVLGEYWQYCDSDDSLQVEE